MSPDARLRRFDDDHLAMVELVAAHALDALEPREARRVDAHLARCPSCQAAVRCQLEALALWALVSGGDTEPPTWLWRSIRAQIHADRRRRRNELTWCQKDGRIS